MNLDCYQIARIFDVNPAEIELKYKKWLEGKNKKSSIITADLNLLSDLSGLSTASISNFLNRKAGSLSKEKAEQLEKLSSLVGYLPSTAAKKLRRPSTICRTLYCLPIFPISRLKYALLRAFTRPIEELVSCRETAAFRFNS